jgi:hypothetical protein
MYMPWAQDPRPVWLVFLRRTARAADRRRVEQHLVAALLRTQGLRSPRVRLHLEGLELTAAVKAGSGRDAVLTALQLLAAAAARVDGLVLHDLECAEAGRLRERGGS